MSDAKITTAASQPDDEYKVGYKKPPKRTQFKPGQSGNPRGRPKGTKNLKTDLVEELGESIVVREGDRHQKLSKQRALLKSVVNRAIQGDAKATAIALSTIMRLLDTGEGAPEIEEGLTEDDQAILKAYEDRLLLGREDLSTRVESDDLSEGGSK